MSLLTSGQARAYNAADFAITGPVSSVPLLFSVWVKATAGTTSPGYVLVCDASASGSLATHSLGVGIQGATTDDPFSGTASTNGTPTYSPATATVGQDGTWQNLIFHVDGASNRILYIDNSATTANTNTRDVTGLERIQFGGVANSGETGVSSLASGYFAYAAIYDVTGLDATAVGNLRTALQTTKPNAITTTATLLHYWPMDGADLTACLLATTGGANLTKQDGISGSTIARDADNPTLSDGASAVVKRLMTMGIGS